VVKRVGGDFKGVSFSTGFNKTIGSWVINYFKKEGRRKKEGRKEGRKERKKEKNKKPKIKNPVASC